MDASRNPLNTGSNRLRTARPHSSHPTTERTAAQVIPEILRWARETAGLSPEDAVKKLGIKDARGVAAIDRLAALENGEVPPTRAMLSRMARKYRRPLLTFYLAQPPSPR